MSSSVETDLFSNICSPQALRFILLFPLLAVFEMRLEDNLLPTLTFLFQSPEFRGFCSLLHGVSHEPCICLACLGDHTLLIVLASMWRLPRSKGIQCLFIINMPFKPCFFYSREIIKQKLFRLMPMMWEYAKTCLAAPDKQKTKMLP